MTKPLSSLAEIINLDDLKSVRHLIFIKNETSQTEVVDHYEFRLVEILPKKIILEGPPKCAQAGHQLQIFFLPRELKKKLVKIPTLDRFPDLIVIMGRISNYELNEDKTRSVMIIEFTQFNQDSWDKVKDVYDDQHQKIESLIKLGKGEQD
jgi:hypothetical protein